MVSPARLMEIVLVSPSSAQQEQEQQQEQQHNDGCKETTFNDSCILQHPKGTWFHAAYHLTSATTGPQTLSLPFAMAALGWGFGFLFLMLGALVSFYAYSLLSTVISKINENNKYKDPNTYSRFQDLCAHILGPRWTFYLVAPLQFMVCFVTVISCVLLGGQCLKAIIPDGTLTLYQFTIIVGSINLLFSQLPSLHHLRHLNLISLIASLGYSFFTVYGCIKAGYSDNAPVRKHSLFGTPTEKMFGMCNALSIMSNVYGNTAMVEIQATIAPPAGKKIFKGLCVCYTVILLTFFPVAIAGYWAFGKECNGNLLLNLHSMGGHSGMDYMPTWMFIITNALIFIQLIGTSLVYCQPTYAVMEEKIIDNKADMFSKRNVIGRLVCRSIFMGSATLFATMLPFFSTINALLGAIGYTPLVFVIPMVFHLLTKDPAASRKDQIFSFIDYAMIIVFSCISLLGCLAAVRQLVFDAQKYHMFADL